MEEGEGEENDGGGNGGICGEHDLAEGDWGDFHARVLLPPIKANHKPPIRLVSPKTALEVRLTDTSSNGTFVNGALLGKGKSVVLQVCIRWVPA